jgi:hypothetical protein
VIAEPPRRRCRQLRAGVAAEGWQREVSLARTLEGVGAAPAADAEFPLPPLVVRLQAIVADGPVRDVVAAQVRASALGEPGLDLAALDLEVRGEEAGGLAGPVEERPAQHVERGRRVAQPGPLAGGGAKGDRLLAHPVLEVKSGREFDRVAGCVVLARDRGPALEDHDVQTGGGQLLGQDATHHPTADDADVRDWRGHCWTSGAGKPSAAIGGRATGRSM